MIQSHMEKYIPCDVFILELVKQFLSAGVKISPNFQGPFNWAPGIKIWGPLIFFKVFDFSNIVCTRIRYWNEPTFSKAIWALGLIFSRPSPNFEGNWHKGPPYFDPWYVVPFSHRPISRKHLCYRIIHNLHIVCDKTGNTFPMWLPECYVT